MTWRVHRMLDPQRAVLVERGDALLRRHELGLRLRRSSPRTNSTIACLAGAVVPRRQRIGLRAAAMRGDRHERAMQDRQRRRSTMMQNLTMRFRMAIAVAPVEAVRERAALSGRPPSAVISLPSVSRWSRRPPSALDLLHDLRRGCSSPAPAAAGTPVGHELLHPQQLADRQHVPVVDEGGDRRGQARRR